MISRRLVRIKTMQSLFAETQNENKNHIVSEKNLIGNLIKTSELYLFLLEFPSAFNDYLLSEREQEKNKYYPDKNKIRDFSVLDGNPVIDALFNQAKQYRRSFFQEDWNNYAGYFEDLFNELKEQDFFIDYRVFDEHDFQQSKEFLLTLYNWLFNSCEKFYNLMEEIYPVWSDDESTIYREIIRGLEKSGPGNIKVFAPETAYHEDVQFAVQLHKEVLKNNENFESEIAGITTNWDPNRIALIDLITIKMAMAEFLLFPDIPLKVTINEYVEIIKSYSTPNSSKFVNGIIDKLRSSYLENNRIRKSEKGMRG